MTLTAVVMNFALLSHSWEDSVTRAPWEETCLASDLVQDQKSLSFKMTYYSKDFENTDLSNDYFWVKCLFNYVFDGYGAPVWGLWFKKNLTSNTQGRSFPVAQMWDQLSLKWIEREKINSLVSSCVVLVSRSQISSGAGNFTLTTHSHELADGAPVWVHAASASCLCVLVSSPLSVPDASLQAMSCISHRTERH